MQRAQPRETGRVVSRLSNLTLYETDGGVDTVMQFGNWWLVNSWGQGATHWARFDFTMRLVETPDGYLAYQNDDTGLYNSDHWRLGPADRARPATRRRRGKSSDLILRTVDLPRGCPTASSTKLRTAQGWPVSLTNGAWWCDATAHVRVHVSDPRLVGNAMKDLRVGYTNAGHAQQQLTALDGTRYEVTAPKDAFNQFQSHATLVIDGIDTRYPLAVSVGREEGSLPNPGPRYRTADGTLMYTQSDDDQLSELVGIYGPWVLDVSVVGLSDHDLTHVASLIPARDDRRLPRPRSGRTDALQGRQQRVRARRGLRHARLGQARARPGSTEPSNFAGRTLPNISDRVHVRRL